MPRRCQDQVTEPQEGTEACEEDCRRILINLPITILDKDAQSSKSINYLFNEAIQCLCDMLHVFLFTM